MTLTRPDRVPCIFHSRRCLTLNNQQVSVLDLKSSVNAEGDSPECADMS